MREDIKEWRKLIEQAIEEGDKIHLQVVLDQVFSDIESVLSGPDEYEDDW
jgi:hypothetical protein